ncbi:carboxylesterase [Parafrankia soli]|uniref:Carboxylic ester hydrolase n=1 Tax=Parafrankia soli TaxID=2599596 RepID=A0A1S1RKZ0_9ACTN|nr:carboxylesterase family protein [Parafrankia soli]OHV46085.1 carboxylesterase [Parafrankia soli]
MNLVRHLAAGHVRGDYLDGIAVFSGIPYAAPLDGPARFAAPRLPERWTGTLDATRFSPSPPQTSWMGGLESLWHPGDGTDCLSVNVWTPDPTGRGLPVLVWFYGGAFLIGSASQPEYDGATLARGGAVVVTVNYRVGFEGFGWLPDAPLNRGLLDQLAALHWVRDNIAQFGGDPGNVTIMGQSAGGTSVAVLVAADEGRGLFNRAIAQSVAGGFLTPEHARATSERIAAALGVRATASDLAAVRPEAIHAVQHEEGQITPYGPILGGELVPALPWRRLRGEVDLVAGSTRDEYRLFAIAAGVADADPAATAVTVGLPPSAAGAYRAAHPDLSDADLNAMILSDGAFRMPSLWCVGNHPGRAYCYEFAWQSPAFAGALGACHGIDTPLTFGNFVGTMSSMLLGNPVPAGVVDLSEQMRSAWISFAATGDPGWPVYRAGKAITRIWDVPSRLAADPQAVSRQIWEQAATAGSGR